MTNIQEHMTEIDRVWTDQVQYSNRQRQQRLQQSLVAFLQEHDRATMELHQKLHAMSHENQLLRENFSGHDALARGRDASITAELDELWLVVNQLGLWLARAWNLRIGTREEIQLQFRTKGLQQQTVQRMCNTPGFWEAMEEQLLPRRSGRLHTSKSEGGDKVPNSA